MANSSTQKAASKPDAEESHPMSFLILCSAYGAALLTAFLTYPFVASNYSSLIIQGLILSIIATSVIFTFSFSIKNISIFDAYWTIVPFPLAIFWTILSSNSISLKNSLLITAIAIYLVRHAILYAKSWSARKFEDFRYLQFKEKFGNRHALFWIFAYFALHIIPACLVFGGMIPIYYALQATEIASPIFYVGFGVVMAGVGLEYFADSQLHSWKQKKKGEFIDEGLWRYSRHPNYLGEILVWWGFFIMNTGTNSTQNWTWIGPLCINSMFQTTTASMMDNHMLEKRPSYAVQMRRVSKLYLWFRNEKAAEGLKGQSKKAE